MKPRRGVRGILYALTAIGLSIGLFPVAARAGDMPLTWDPNSEADLSGYKIHIGPFSRSYSQTIDVGHVTTYTVTNLSDGQTYYAAVTAYDIYGNESGFSNEVSATIAAAPPPSEPTSEPLEAPPPIPGSPQFSGDATNITVSWPALENYTALKGYHVWFGMSTTSWVVDQIVNQPTTSAAFAANGPGSYWACVRSINTADMESQEQMCNGTVLEPAPEPTSEPTSEPASDPTSEPTSELTSEQVSEPTSEPASEPTSELTSEPAAEPTSELTSEPTTEPTSEPTSELSSEPTSEPAPAEETIASTEEGSDTTLDETSPKRWWRRWWQ